MNFLSERTIFLLLLCINYTQHMRRKARKYLLFFQKITIFIGKIENSGVVKFLKNVVYKTCLEFRYLPLNCNLVLMALLLLAISQTYD